MKNTLLALAFGLFAMVLYGCSPKSGTGGGGATTSETPGTDDGTKEIDTSTLAPPAEGTAVVKGKVTLAGEPPAMPTLRGIDGKPECSDQHDTPPKAEVVITGPGGTLANCFVHVSKGARRSRPPAEPVLFDQKKCLYVPHLLGVQVGQEVHVTNSDPALHNVHILPSPALGDTNRAQPKDSPPIKLKFKKPALGVTVKCDVHPWMLAYACVVDHPFFAVTGVDGAFELPKKLPAGTYTITAWHEKYGTLDQEVTLADGETKEVNFEFK